ESFAIAQEEVYTDRQHTIQEKVGKCVKRTSLAEGQSLSGPIERVCPQPMVGLSSKQVEARIQAGAHGGQTQNLTPSVTRIVLKNTLTLFNLLNLFLAVVIIMVGRPENILFIGVAIANTLMGIYQELKSKKILDKLSVLAQGKVTVIRDSAAAQIPQDTIVLD